jgi:hypothetical protein
VTTPSPSFDHLLRLTDDTGLFEHARGATPRRDCGYCVDDVARGLVVVCREPAPSDALVRLSERYLAFLAHAQAADGCVANRLSYQRHWLDSPGLGDWWGRALWGLGTAAARGPTPSVRHDALVCFEASAGRRTPWRRAMAFAALGAAEVLTVHSGHQGALALLADSAVAFDGGPVDESWPWPEPRLSYANAVLADALIAAGHASGDGSVLDHGLRLLGWLLAVETRDGHLSVTPAGGWQPGEPRPAFDQQPIEVASLADACARAFELTAEGHWSDGIRRAVGWFLGDNDSGIPLFDPVTGGGCDGLGTGGANTNQGAESTLALLSTFQHGRRLAGVDR